MADSSLAKLIFPLLIFLGGCTTAPPVTGPAPAPVPDAPSRTYEPPSPQPLQPLLSTALAKGTLEDTALIMATMHWQNNRFSPRLAEQLADIYSDPTLRSHPCNTYAASVKYFTKYAKNPSASKLQTDRVIWGETLRLVVPLPNDERKRSVETALAAAIVWSGIFDRPIMCECSITKSAIPSEIAGSCRTLGYSFRR